MKKVYLGGTCNKSKWRDAVIERLKIEYFNPMLDVWTEEGYQRELIEREICDYCLYVITPKLVGTYSIAELIDESNKRPEKTLFCYLKTDEDKEFTKEQCISLDKIAIMVQKNGGKYFDKLDDIIDYLNREE